MGGCGFYFAMALRFQYLIHTGCVWSYLLGVVVNEICNKMTDTSYYNMQTGHENKYLE